MCLFCGIEFQNRNMNEKLKIFAIAGIAATASSMIQAQTFNWTETTEGNVWKNSKTVLKANPSGTPDVKADLTNPIVTFNDWGVTFNELDWDALCMLTREEQDAILQKVFSPNGDLRATRGRISMGANDYARSWYSCDEVAGDLELRYFNIDRDKTSVIPFIRAAQKYNPGLTFWVSPWCPPSWMKINHDYPVLSSEYNDMPKKIDYLLYAGSDAKTDPDEMKLTGKRDNVFPRQIAENDYFIQDPRYLQAYANMFCKFIDAYAEQGIPIDRVIYQNEAYSYTPYPGCAWTAEGTNRFNRDYLGPTLKRLHPEVELYMGTFNTNRRDHVEKVLSDKGQQEYTKGVAFQWEGREVLPFIRAQHPEWKYICSESECGWGSFDWGAAEHTFELINHYLGNGCHEYTFWNFILADNGVSPWGWKQNSLIRVNSKDRTFSYTPEYQAVRHYTSFIKPGSKIVGYKGQGADKKPILVALTPKGKHVVIAGNFSDTVAPIDVQIGAKHLTASLKPHSFNSFVEK